MIIIHKKYSLLSYLIIFTLIVSPAISYAINLDESPVTEENLREIRNILLMKQEDTSDNKYDFDNDNKLTINDLILGLINFNTFEEDDNTDIEEDDNTDVEVEKVYNVKINYSVNKGVISSTTSGGTWTTSNDLIYQDGSLLQSIINYGGSTGSAGIINYNNVNWVNVTKQGHSAISGAEWICLSGCTTVGKTYSQEVVYKASDFCDASNGDCTVTLGINWRKNIITIQYSANGGTPTASTSGGTWTIGDNNLIYKNNVLLTNVMGYGDKLSTTYGLQNYNNSSSLNITRKGYSVPSGSEWKCLSGCTTSGKTFNQTSAYEAFEFCDASYNDCTVTVGVNWNPNTYSINLNNQGATTAGTSVIYEKYATGIYLDSNLSNKMTTSSNKITIPSKTGYTFGGYYTEINGAGTQMISSSGYITSNLNTTKYSNTATLYAKWINNSVNIRYNTNGGTISSSNSSGTWSTDSTGLVYLNGSVLVTSVRYGLSLEDTGLNNWNNSNYLNISRKNYTAVSGAEWVCLSGCTTSGKTYDHAKVYTASDFCDASNGNCTVVLGVNWTASDNTAPVISSCSAVIKDNKTTFNIITSDTDIVKYVVGDDNSVTFTNKNYTVNSVIENPKITAYDSSNNTTSVNCSWYYDQIAPKGTENVIHDDRTDTLKVWIELNERDLRTDYYTTHIWVKDAYKQFKSQVPDNFGGELLMANALMTNAVEDYGLEDKLAVAVNASGFVRNGYFGQDIYNANPKFDMTSGSPIVIVNGVVKRDLSSETLPNSVYSVYGLNKDGMLSYYNYPGGTNAAGNGAISKKYKMMVF